MCASAGISGLPSGPVASRSTGSFSALPPSGAPLVFIRPNVCSCSCRNVRSQGSISIRIRRLTR